MNHEKRLSFFPLALLPFQTCCLYNIWQIYKWCFPEQAESFSSGSSLDNSFSAIFCMMFIYNCLIRMLAFLQSVKQKLPQLCHIG